jgi:hypothetical protein
MDTFLIGVIGIDANSVNLKSLSFDLHTLWQMVLIKEDNIDEFKELYFACRFPCSLGIKLGYSFP